MRVSRPNHWTAKELAGVSLLPVEVVPLVSYILVAEWSSQGSTVEMNSRPGETAVQALLPRPCFTPAFSSSVFFFFFWLRWVFIAKQAFSPVGTQASHCSGFSRAGAGSRAGASRLWSTDSVVVARQAQLLLDLWNLL